MLSTESNKTGIFSFVTLYARPRILAMLFLGFSSGLPLLLTMSTLSLWMAEVGVDKTTIGLFAILGFPYAFKFLWSPIMDQLRIPYLGKRFGQRRSWMLISQLMLMLSLYGLGFSNPAETPLITAIWAFLVALSSASQDIMIDAYRVEMLKENEQGAGAGMYVFGYRLGMLTAGAGALFIASFASWQTTYSIMALLIAVGPLCIALLGEPKHPVKKKHSGSWFAHAVIEPFTNFMQKPYWLSILIFIVLYKLGDAFITPMANPFYWEMGFTKIEIASITKVFGFAATIFGALLGGIMVHRIGVMKSLLWGGIFQMCSNLFFITQANLGHHLEFLTLTIAVEAASGGLGTAAFVAYLSKLCDKEFTVTQYALFSALASYGRTFLSAPSGWFADHMSWQAFFLLSTAIAVPGLWLWYVLSRKEQQLGDAWERD